MYIAVAIVHVIVSLFLVVVVLLQSGKAADLAGAFGGLGSQTVFGPRGSATVLTRATTVSAVLFMITSLTLSILATGGGSAPGSDVLKDVSGPPKAAPATATPSGTPSAPAVPLPGQSSGTTKGITVTPNVGGQQGAPIEVQIPTKSDKGK